MSLRDVLCVSEKRDELAHGIAESVRVIGMDEDVLEILKDFAHNGTPIQKNYIILFGTFFFAYLG